MSVGELAQLRVRLAKMRDGELLDFYEAAHRMCRLDRTILPRAASVQQLVTAWRILNRRLKDGPSRRA
jgi:hypothetical protein